ncbi:MAG: galactose oxidase-like domain-containing protein [Saprospiraceae bacterium]
MTFKSILTVLSCLFFQIVLSAQVLKGTILDDLGSPVVNARITLFNNDTTLFRETRTDVNGRYSIADLPGGGPYLFFGVAAKGKEYFQNVTTGVLDTIRWDATLFPETNPGDWNIIIQSPEALGGTDLGVLLPDGNIFYCHSTKDPFVFVPSLNDTVLVKGHDKVQGCVGPVLLTDGKIMFAGGTDKEIYGPGTRKVKTFDPIKSQWKYLPDLLDYRWYPTITPLFDGRYLIAGGGGLDNPIRVKSSEVYDPNTGISIPADTLKVGNEVSPIIPLLNGKILMTHRPPQLFDPETMQWELAGDFVQSNRMANGDHSDHELVHLPDGHVLAVGFKSFVPGQPGVNLEMYDPDLDQWSLRSNFSPTRSRAKAVLLPDQKVLVIGGYKEDPNDNSPVNNYGYMALTDQYDPASDTWRRLSPMNLAREYHAITALVPDGRIIAVGGEGQPGNEPPMSIIEAFSPPYLFRGIRPEIHNFDTTTFKRGEYIHFDVSKTNALTKVVLMSTAVLTHFMNSGNNRFLNLEFTQSGNQVTAAFPSDSLHLMPGWYMLFGMVDDIPSVGQIIHIEKGMAEVTATKDIEPAIITARVYPNPTDGQLQIEITGAEVGQKVKLKIFDSLGRHVFNDEVTSASIHFRHEVELPKNISPGILHLVITLKECVIVKNIMLQ